MKILLVCNKYPFPPHDGGSLATYNMAKGMVAAGNRVDILAMNTSRHFGGEERKEYHIEGLGRVTGVFVENSINYPDIFRNLLFSSYPYTAERYVNEKFENTLSKLAGDSNYDIIQIEGLYLLQYVPALRKCSHATVVYRAHNVEHMIWDTFSRRIRNGIRRLYMAELRRRVKKMELGFINSYDLLATITDNDLELLNKLGNKKPAISVPFGMFPDDFQNNDFGNQVDMNLQYIGALDWLPNIESLEWFVRKVWVAVRNRYPGLRFFVAGRNAKNSFVSFLKKNHVDFVGEVADSRKFLCQAGILLVPLFSGSGIRVRIIEAMFAGKPIIASNFAVSGIPVESGRQMLLAENEHDFAGNIEKLISDAGYAKGLGINAHEFAVRHYNNYTISGELTGFYKKWIT